MFSPQTTKKKILNSLNPVFFSFLVFLGILLKTSGIVFLPEIFQQWDLLLPFIIFFGQRRSLPEGLILCLFTTHLYSLSSGAPIGVFTIHYLFLFLLSRNISYVVFGETWVYILNLVFILSIMERFSLPIIASFFNHSWPIFSSSHFSVGRILFNTSASFFIFELLVLLDRFTFKTEQITIQISEDSL